MMDFKANCGFLIADNITKNVITMIECPTLFIKIGVLYH